MRILFTNSTVNIKNGMTVSGMSKQRETLRVLRGRIWVTMEGSPDDYWLTVDDTFVMEPGKLVVIEAYHSDSQVYLSYEQGSESTGDEPHRAFDFFRGVSPNPVKAAMVIDDATAAEAQFGYTGGLCPQQKPQAAPTCIAA